jgi:hypothetical protein
MPCAYARAWTSFRASSAFFRALLRKFMAVTNFSLNLVMLDTFLRGFYPHISYVLGRIELLNLMHAQPHT